MGNTTATMNPEHDHIFHIVIVGDSAVGKSNLVLRFIENAYSDTLSSTIGASFTIKEIVFEGKKIKLAFWDLNAVDRSQPIREPHYSRAHGVIVVYDVTSKDSFGNVPKWLKEIDSYAAKNVSRLLIGNKCDSKKEGVHWIRQRKIDYETGKKFADQLGIPFFETSARSAINVDEAFMTLVAEIKRRMDPPASVTNVSREEEINYSERKEPKDLSEDTDVKVINKTEEIKAGEQQQHENSFKEASTQTELEFGQFEQDFKEILFSGNSSNVVLKVGNQECRAHTCVLAARTPAFMTVIIHETEESISPVIDLKDIDLEAFPDFLNYLCTGNIEKLTSENAFKLYAAAVKYKIDKLKGICMDHLLMNITTENFCDVLTLSLQCDEKDLNEVCLHYFLENSLAIVRTTKWRTFLCENPMIGNELFLKHLEMTK